MLVVLVVLFAASIDGVSVLAATAAPTMRRLLGMRPSAAALLSLIFSPVAASQRLYSRNDLILLAVCCAFVAAVCISGVSIAAVSMRSRPVAAALRLLFVNFSYRCHDVNLALSLAAVIVCVVVAGIPGLFIAAATPGTCCVIVLSIFVAGVADDIAAASLAAVGFAVGTSLDAVSGTCLHCCSIAVAHGIIIIAHLICVVSVSASSGSPNLSWSV